jgi:drug/metabolite transporter (DMT)-like permease
MSAHHESHRVGVSSLLASALLVAISSVYYSGYIRALDPFAFTCFSFTLMAVLFHGIYWFTKPRVVPPIRGMARADLALLNVFTALTFASFFYALKFIEPAIVGAMEVGGGPIVALIVQWYRTRHLDRIYVLCVTGIGCGSAVLIAAAIQGRTGLAGIGARETTLGIIAALINAAAVCLAALYSKRLSRHGWSSARILAHRSYVIILFCFAVAGRHAIFEVASYWKGAVFASITGVVIPLYLLQLGIKHCSTLIVVISLAAIPVFAIGFELFDPRIHLSPPVLVGVSILFASTVLAAVHSGRRASIARPETNLPVH